MRPKRPLRYRLPNAPALFVGRRDKIALLRRALGRGPVSVVHGLGGLGKTSLVLTTLHRHFRDRVANAIHVVIAETSSHGPAAEIARALAEVDGHELRWEELSNEPELLIATAIDLAEEHEHWIVLDDLDVSAESNASFLDAVAR